MISIQQNMILRLFSVILFCIGFFNSAVALELPGWSSDFIASTNTATVTGRPLILVWANKGCSHCETLEADVQKPEFTSWMKKSGYEYCFVQGIKGKDPDGSETVKKFARYAAYTKNDGPTSYPFVCFYWIKPDGTKSAKSFSSSSASTVMSLADDFFVGYNKPNDAFFPVAGTPKNRYEVLSDTKYVDVRLLRNPDLPLLSDQNELVIQWPRNIKDKYTKTVEWGIGETNQFVRIDLSRGDMNFPLGESIHISLNNSDGIGISETSIHFVELLPNSTKNPHWKGEYSAEDLPWGEWTLDYATALEKTKDEGYLFALFSGVLWCPHCIGLDDSLLSPTNKVFYSWAKENKVALVLFDQPRFGFDCPRLLNDLPDPNKSGIDSVSGSAYLSRRMLNLDSVQVAEIKALQAEKTVKWLAPESTASRLSNPTLLLIRSNGEVAGRFNAYEDQDKTFDVQENMLRLNDFLLLKDEGNDLDSYISTTSLQIGIDEARIVNFQVSERQKCFKIKSDRAGFFKFEVINQIDSISNSIEIEVLIGGVVVARGAGSVLRKLTLAELERGAYLRVSAFSAAGTEKISEMSSTSRFECELTCSMIESQADGTVDGPGFDPDGKPCLGWEEYEILLHQNISDTKSFNLVNVDNAESVKIRKISGRLPGGVKLKYDKESGRVVLSGVPNNVLNEPIVVKYEVVAVVDGVKQVGQPSTISISVADPKILNKAISEKRKATIPLFSGDLMAGILTFSQSTKNKLSVKYEGTESKTVSINGYWSSMDEYTGVVKAILEKNGTRIHLTMDSTGRISAVFTGLDELSSFAVNGVSSFYGEAVLSSEKFDKFNGFYTVVLPSKDGMMGSGYLKLKFTSKAQINSGQVKYSGVLPDKTTISGNAYLTLVGSDMAVLPVFKRKSGTVLSALLRICANAGNGINDPELSRAVTLDHGEGYWLAKDDKSNICKLDVAGSWYLTGSLPKELCDRYGISSTFGLYVGDERIATVTAGQKFELSNMLNKSKLSFSRSTGEFSGYVYLNNMQSTNIKGVIKGILNPGWGDCGCGDGYKILPFGEGSVIFKNKENGKLENISLPIWLIPE